MMAMGNLSCEQWQNYVNRATAKVISTMNRLVRECHNLDNLEDDLA